MAAEKMHRKERIHWIDIARGIGIILVLYGHLLGADTLRFLIYAFHIPLFFFLSGMVFKNYGNQSFLSLTLKNAKQLLLPYLLIALVTYGIMLLKPPLIFPTEEALTKQLYGIFYGSGNNGYLAFNVALWFLPCLFFAKMLFTALTRWITNTKLLIILVLACGLGGFILAQFFPGVKLAFGIESALTAIVFFAAGYAFKQREAVIKHIDNHKLLAGIAALVLFIPAAFININLFGMQIDMRVNRLNNEILFYLGAFSGILLTLLVSMKIKQQAFLQYLGRNSLILFAWHTPIFVYLKLFAATIIANQYAVPLWYGLQVLYLLATGIIILGIQSLINKLTSRKV